MTKDEELLRQALLHFSIMTTGVAEINEVANSLYSTNALRSNQLRGIARSMEPVLQSLSETGLRLSKPSSEGVATYPVQSPAFWHALGELEDACERAINKGYAWHGLDEIIANLNAAQSPPPPITADSGEAVASQNGMVLVDKTISAPKVSDKSDLYSELLYAVHRKFPTETRHETALRYIREAEREAELSAESAKKAQP